jgi:hypothetical protein
VADGICNNCGAGLTGPYCSRCGQKEADTDWRSLGDIAREFWDELVSLDFKSVRTIFALSHPGHLAAEFIAGRRRRYLTPLKTYLLAAALFFVVAPRITDFTFDGQMAQDREGSFRSRVEARIAATGVDRALFADRFERNLQTTYTVMPIVSVIVFTLLLRWLYGAYFPWLGPHLAVALYQAAFGFLMALVLHLLNYRLAPDLWILLALQVGILVPYVFVSLRRVYGESARRTLPKAIAILALAFAVDVPLNMAAVILSVKLT